MNKLKYYFIIIFLCICSFIAGITINSVNAENHKFNSIENTNGISYDYVYVNGTRYIIFTNGTDIEVVK